MKPDKQKAFFFDRDGVINIDHGYVSKIEDFEFADGIFPIMRTLAKKGYALVVVTNQSGIGRGYYSQDAFEQVNRWMLSRLAEEQIKITAVYCCPHAPDEGCFCRKPAPGMFLQAIEDHHVDPACSWMVGDKDDDMIAAEAAGIRSRVLLGNANPVHSTHIISNVSELLELPL